MHWVFVSKFAPANLQLRGSAITLETEAHIYTLYSSSLFEYPIVPLLKFRYLRYRLNPFWAKGSSSPEPFIGQRMFCFLDFLFLEFSSFYLTTFLH